MAGQKKNILAPSEVLQVVRLGSEDLKEELAERVGDNNCNLKQHLLCELGHLLSFYRFGFARLICKAVYSCLMRN